MHKLLRQLKRCWKGVWPCLEKGMLVMQQSASTDWAS